MMNRILSKIFMSDTRQENISTAEKHHLAMSAAGSDDLQLWTGFAKPPLTASEDWLQGAQGYFKTSLTPLYPTLQPRVGLQRAQTFKSPSKTTKTPLEDRWERRSAWLLTMLTYFLKHLKYLKCKQKKSPPLVVVFYTGWESYSTVPKTCCVSYYLHHLMSTQCFSTVIHYVRVNY